MKVHILKPFDLEKNLGRAYNEAMSRIPEGDWACLMDLDTMFLTPDAGNILHEYAEKFSHAGMFTCYTSRIHPLSKVQLLNEVVSEDTNLLNHIEKAYKQKERMITATPINRPVSGFLMMISKATWNEVKFTEDFKCLGVDNFFCDSLLKAGKSIYRMDNLYVWHTYRLKNGITNKTHLL